MDFIDRAIGQFRKWLASGYCSEGWTYWTTFLL